MKGGGKATQTVKNEIARLKVEAADKFIKKLEKHVVGVGEKIIGSEESEKTVIRLMCHHPKHGDFEMLKSEAGDYVTILHKNKLLLSKAKESGASPFSSHYIIGKEYGVNVKANGSLFPWDSSVK